jgi:hypothetical protein
MTQNDITQLLDVKGRVDRLIYDMKFLIVLRSVLDLAGIVILHKVQGGKRTSLTEYPPEQILRDAYYTFRVQLPKKPQSTNA